jgi:putative ubiquitin-RnfH superfamily antitoxin RatB of RatAB toxin-antitoxin module
MKVEIAYTRHANEQTLLSVQVRPNSTVRQAIDQANLLELYPEMDLTTQPVGIFSRKVSLDTPLQPGDRVEIYRPLHMDPKEARRLRAMKNQ